MLPNNTPKDGDQKINESANQSDSEMVKETKEELLQSLIDLGASQEKIDEMRKSMETEKTVPVKKDGVETKIEDTSNSSKAPETADKKEDPNFITKPAETKFTSYEEYEAEQELYKVFEEDKQKEEEALALKKKRRLEAEREAKFKTDLENFLLDSGVTWATEVDKQADLWIWEKFGKFKRTEAKDSDDAKVHIEFESPEKNVYWSNATMKKEHADKLMKADKEEPQYMLGKELLALQEKVRKETGELVQPEPNDNANVYIHRLMNELEEYKKANKENEEYQNSLDKPEEKTVQGIKIKEWENAIDFMLKQKGFNFESYSDREKEAKLQQLFGHNNEEIKFIESLKKNGKVIRMDYFRDLPTWIIVEKIPARYFFDFKDVKMADGSKLSKEDINTLFISGVLKEEIILSGNEKITGYSFVRLEELEQIADELSKLSETSPRPIGYETIEQFVTRITKGVRKYNKFKLSV
jgi:hypothetical protein